jgi:hypothetical protein
MSTYRLQQKPLPPNKPMQLTPLRVRKIGAFLERRISSNTFPIYRWWHN